jgi:hypothetical protein
MARHGHQRAASPRHEGMPYQLVGSNDEDALVSAIAIVVLVLET